MTVASVTPDAIVEQLAGDRRQPAQSGHRKGSYLMRQGDVSIFSPYLIGFGSLEPGAQITKIENLDPDLCSSLWICSITGRVVGKEIVRVPAGEFEAIKVEVQHAWTTRSQGAADSGGRTLTIWYSPQTKRAVKFSSHGSRSAYFESEFDLELESYQLN